MQSSAPSGVMATIGERSHKVRTVRRLFGLSDDDLFDDKLEQRLRGFQKIAGLVPNGWLTEHTFNVLCRVKNYSDDGGATVSMAVLGSVASGLPLAVATSNTFEDKTTFWVTFLGGLIAIGIGVGKFYQWWKRSIESNYQHGQSLQALSDKVGEIVEQIERIEARQVAIKNDIAPLIRKVANE